MTTVSVRWRLTIVFATITIVSTSVLLTGVYLLVRESQQRGDPISSQPGSAAQESVDDLISAGPRQDEQVVEEAVEVVRDEAVDDTLDQLLAWSVVGLVGMAGVAVLGGWLFAGRALRPVHTITSRARAISAASLEDRIALAGPADELRELAETFDAMLERLEQAFALERRLVASMSHELRTPLANQQAALELALSDPGATVEELREAGEIALGQGRRANLTIDALLVLAQVEAGSRGLPKGRLDLDELVRTQVAALGVPDAGPDWQVDLTPVPVQGHPELLTRMLHNLLVNAVTYNLPGGYVDVRLSHHDGTALLTVTNPGPVIEETAARELALPFRRGPRDRTEHRGVGLGLSIVEAVVRQHQGSLSLTPLPTGGLRVQVLLPSEGEEGR